MPAWGPLAFFPQSSRKYSEIAFLFRKIFQSHFSILWIACCLPSSASNKIDTMKNSGDSYEYTDFSRRAREDFERMVRARLRTNPSSSAATPSSEDWRSTPNRRDSLYQILTAAIQLIQESIDEANALEENDESSPPDRENTSQE